MTTTDIKSLLPDPNKDNYEKLKREHPFNILSKYVRAISEKYPQKLDGQITESADVSNRKLINYALYITAYIGKGYSYRLLEVVPTTFEMYPLKVTIFERNPQEFAQVHSYIEFELLLNNIFQMGFTQTLLMNLVSQVDLYNESRSQKFDWEDEVNKK